MKAYFLQGTILCQAIILNAKLHAARCALYAAGNGEAKRERKIEKREERK